MNSMRMVLSVVILAMVPIVPFAQDSLTPLEEFLEKFDSSPREVMNSLPPQTLPSGQLKDRGPIKFPSHPESQADFMARLFEKVRQTTPRKLERKWTERTFAEPKGASSLESKFFADVAPEPNFIALVRQGLSRGKPKVQSWADSYWPSALGGIGTRYADKNYPISDTWTTNYEYYQSRPITDYLASEMDIQMLSPGEKYDLLLGLTSGGITDYRWREFKGINAELKEGIPRWYGLCNGWAAVASSGVPEPGGPVELVGAHGHKILFYQSDVKALTTYLWTMALPQPDYSGARCWIMNPEQDENGRIVDETCFDNNPMSWHIALTHLVGKMGKNFIFDSTFDYEVWNYPISSYEMTYFNPKTLKTKSKINDAIEPIESFSSDKFKKYRSPSAAYVVGVSVAIEHLKAMTPHAGIHGSPPMGTLTYIYDLELDKDYNIVGGEWYNNARPDFLWRIPEGKFATTESDALLSHEEWDTNLPLPAKWQELGIKEAQRGLPLSSVVNRMIELSRKAE